MIDDDIYGNMVNYTKRVESVQNDGGITISDTAKREISNEKAARHSGLVYQPCTMNLKGIPTQETVWLVVTPKAAMKGFFKGLLTPIRPL